MTFAVLLARIWQYLKSLLTGKLPNKIGGQMASLTPSPKMQFLDASGAPLVGGKLYSYAAGTTTPLATYTDYGGGTPNANPVILDSRGEANVWLGTSLYKLKLTNSVDAEIWTVDNVSGQASLSSLAASSGSSLVGTIAVGTGAVTRTVQSKLNDYVSVKDFGAIGNGTTDDTASIQACIDALSVSGRGGVVYLPPGQYKVTSNLNITWPNATTETSLARVVLRGAGSGLTFILDYRTSVGSNGCITYDFSASGGASNHYLKTITGGFSLIKSINATSFSLPSTIIPGTGTGLYLNMVPSGVYEDIQIMGYSTCLNAVDCLGGEFRNMVISQCDIGINMAVSTFSSPNAVVMDHVTVNISNSWGVKVYGGAVSMYGCSFSFNGPSGAGAPNGAVYQQLDSLHKAITIDGCWFETNFGAADVYIYGAAATGSVAAASITNCQFVRAANYASGSTNDIAVNLSSGTNCDLVVMNCGFMRAPVAVPNASTKYISVIGAAAANCRMSLIGNNYQSTTESPLVSGTDASAILTSLVLQETGGSQTIRLKPVASTAWLDINNGAAYAVPGSGGGLAPPATDTQYLGLPSFRWLRAYLNQINLGPSEVIVTSGSGSPEGVVTAGVGSLYTNTGGSTSTTLYVKTSGSGNTGWTAK